MNPWWRRPSPDENDDPPSRTRSKAKRNQALDFDDVVREARNAQDAQDESLDEPELAENPGDAEVASDVEIAGETSGGGGRPRRRRRRGGRRRKSAGDDNGRMRTEPSRVATAALFDLDRLVTMLQDVADERAFSAALERLVGSASGSVRRAYTAGERHPALATALERADFELVGVPKGGAVVQMSVDAMQLASRPSESPRFLLLADPDALSPLVAGLRDGGSDVELLTRGDWAESSGRETEPKPPRPTRPPTQPPTRRPAERPAPARQTEAVENGERERPRSRTARPQADSISADDLLMRAIVSVAGDAASLGWASLVLQAMQRQDPSFNEQRAGFDSFDAFLENAARRGLIEIRREPRSSTYLVTRYRAPAAATAD